VSQGIERGFCCVVFVFIFSDFFKSKSVFILLIQATVVYPEDDTVCRHFLTYTVAVFWKIQSTSNLVLVLVEYIYGQLCRHIEGSPVLIHPQHTAISLATARLLCNWCYTQQYSSSTFVSLHFVFYKEKLCVSKMLFHLFIYLFRFFLAGGGGGV
jgi:hypothetical protein